MALPSVVPILALVLGVGLVFSKKAEAKTGPAGPGPGPGPGPSLGGPEDPGPLAPGQPPPPPPHNFEVPALFTVRSGDLPAGVVRKSVVEGEGVDHGGR